MHRHMGLTQILFHFAVLPVSHEIGKTNCKKKKNPHLLLGEYSQTGDFGLLYRGFENYISEIFSV